MKDADILKLDRPKKNQPIDYYSAYLQHIDPMLSLFEIRTGYLRWIMGAALEEAISSRKVKHGQYGRLLKLLDLSRSTAYNCRAIAKQIPAINARRLGYSVMLRMCGLLNDAVEDFESHEDREEDDFDLNVVGDDEEYDEGERPLPTITYHNFLPKLLNVRNTLDAIASMDYAAESREDAVKRYLEARKHVAAIQRHCGKVERLLTKRIAVGRKGRRSRTA